jgi:hypothetical protein
MKEAEKLKPMCLPASFLCKWLLVFLAVLICSGCQDLLTIGGAGIKEESDIDYGGIKPPVTSIALKPEDTPMLHVGGLHTAEDFARIREKLAANEEPWVSGYNRLTTNEYAQESWTPWPTQEIRRGGGSGENYMNAARSAAAAYQLALRWKISEEDKYAAQAVYILNRWAAECTAVTGDTNMSLAAGLYGYEFAVAGELLRDYTDWSPEDFQNFQQWMVNVFWPKNYDFLNRHHDTFDTHYWANWDLCNLASTLAIGILADRRDIYNYAVNYLQNGIGNGNFYKAVNHIHYTADGEELGQMQESGRDQGHATMCIALMGVICQLTWNQGDDFYGLDNNRFLKGCEYTAKYNVANLDVPFAIYVRKHGNKNSNPNGSYETHTLVSSAGRGNVRPMWTAPYWHYKSVKNLDESKFKYTEMGVNAVGVEGGGGNYGQDSGGFDQLGFGTLMYTR